MGSERRHFVPGGGGLTGETESATSGSPNLRRGPPDPAFSRHLASCRPEVSGWESEVWETVWEPLMASFGSISQLSREKLRRPENSREPSASCRMFTAQIRSKTLSTFREPGQNLCLLRVLVPSFKRKLKKKKKAICKKCFLLANFSTEVSPTRPVQRPRAGGFRPAPGRHRQARLRLLPLPALPPRASFLSLRPGLPCIFKFGRG